MCEHYALKLSLCKHSYVHMYMLYPDSYGTAKHSTLGSLFVIAERNGNNNNNNTQKNRPYPFPEHHVTFAKGLICYLFPICTDYILC